MELVKCRTCLKLNNKKDCYNVLYKCYLTQTTKQALLHLVPQMGLTLRDEDMVCKKCLRSVTASVKFITNCLRVETILAEQRFKVYTSLNDHDYCSRKLTENIHCKRDFSNINKSVSILKSALAGGNRDNDIVIDNNVQPITIEIYEEPVLDNFELFIENDVNEAKRKQRKRSYKRKNQSHTEIANENVVRPSTSAKNRKRVDSEDEEEEYSCSTCSEKFTDKEVYNSHLKIHPPHKCDQCEKAFVKRESLKAHKITHNPPNTYMCEKCGKGYKDPSALRLHQKLHNEESYICEKCAKVFKTRPLLRNHIKYMHEKDNLVFDHQCTFCGKLFRNLSMLDIHCRLVHLKEKPFQCDFCQKKFGRKDYLKNHRCPRFLSKDQVKRRKLLKVPIKDDGGPLPCKFCGKVLNDKAHLKNHLYRHVHRHKCHFCPQTFIAKVTRAKHELIHQKLPVFFRCNICYRKFRTKEELDEHTATQIHRRQPRYSCEICGMKFHRRFTLSQHTLIEHVASEDKTVKVTDVLEHTGKLEIELEQDALTELISISEDQIDRHALFEN